VNRLPRFQKYKATIALPAVLGHEGSGTVERVGARYPDVGLEGVSIGSSMS
jgi:Zn-dependent alcohol dehydrogenase